MNSHRTSLGQICLRLRGWSCPTAVTHTQLGLSATHGHTYFSGRLTSEACAHREIGVLKLRQGQAARAAALAVAGRRSATPQPVKVHFQSHLKSKHGHAVEGEALCVLTKTRGIAPAMRCTIIPPLDPPVANRASVSTHSSASTVRSSKLKKSRSSKQVDQPQCAPSPLALHRPSCLHVG